MSFPRFACSRIAGWQFAGCGSGPWCRAAGWLSEVRNLNGDLLLYEARLGARFVPPNADRVGRRRAGIEHDQRLPVRQLLLNLLIPEKQIVRRHLRRRAVDAGVTVVVRRGARVGCATEAVDSDAIGHVRGE